MPEQYVGPKFKTIFLQKTLLADDRIKDIIKACRKFGQLGFYPSYKGGSAGNTSFRTQNGFIITASYTDLNNIKPTDFTEVVKCDKEKMEVYVNGYKAPSSETFLHSAIYEKRKDINLIFHGHSRIISQNAAKLGIPITEKDQPYGTLELVNEVMKVLDSNNLIVMHGHGFLCLGKSIQDAENIIIGMIKR